MRRSPPRYNPRSDVHRLGAPGASLFHYTTAEKAFAYILETEQLRLSPYNEMRDPLEFEEYFFQGAPVVEAVERVEKTDSELWGEANAIVRGLRA